MSEHSVDEWMTRLSSKPLRWLVNQRSPVIRGYNGKNYDDAIDALIELRESTGECIPRVRSCNIVVQEDAGEVEVIDYGGKGGKMRIVHPR